MAYVALLKKGSELAKTVERLFSWVNSVGKILIELAGGSPQKASSVKWERALQPERAPDEPRAQFWREARALREELYGMMLRLVVLGLASLQADPVETDPDVNEYVEGLMDGWQDAAAMTRQAKESTPEQNWQRLAEAIKMVRTLISQAIESGSRPLPPAGFLRKLGRKLTGQGDGAAPGYILEKMRNAAKRLGQLDEELRGHLAEMEQN
jgi:hypothetical protein